MSIQLDPRWTLNGPPSALPLTSSGAFLLTERAGEVTLPDDYLAFLRAHDGAGLWHGRSWFLLHFDGEVQKIQIDCLRSSVGVQNGSAVSFPPDGSGQNYLPPKFVCIGFDVFNEIKLFIKADLDAADHGHVYAWMYAPEEWMTGSNTKGLGRVANSFTDFMNGLVDEDAL